MQDKSTQSTASTASTASNHQSEDVVRPVVFDIHGRLDSSFREIEAMLHELKQNADPRVRLLAMAEMRRHIQLAGRTLETAIKAEAVREFQAGILEALADAGVKVRRKVIGLFEVRGEEEV